MEYSTLFQSNAIERNVSPLIFITFFTPEECGAIRKLAESYESIDGEMSDPEEGYRECSISIIKGLDPAHWLRKKLDEIVELTHESYQFEFNDAPPLIQFTRYAIGGKIDWHVDFDFESAVSRKLSISVQLSARTEYSGGALEFFPTGELQLSRDQGTVIVFPAFFHHRVTPISSGQRDALVVWFSGKNFR